MRGLWLVLVIGCSGPATSRTLTIVHDEDASVPASPSDDGRSSSQPPAAPSIGNGHTSSQPPALSKKAAPAGARTDAASVDQDSARPTTDAQETVVPDGSNDSGVVACELCIDAARESDFDVAATAHEGCQDELERAYCRRIVQSRAPTAVKTAVYNGHCDLAQSIYEAVVSMGASTSALTDELAPCGDA